MSRAGVFSILVLLNLVVVNPATAVTHLHRGDHPPPIALKNLDGGNFALNTESGHAVVLLFAELYHERSLEAARMIQGALADRRLADARVTAVMIVAQQADNATLKKSAAERGVKIPVLHDCERAVYAAYQVSVLPSVVVIDRQGRVVHATAGLSTGLSDVIADCVLHASGLLSAEQLDRTIHPASQPAAPEAGVRAARLTELARQLSRSGMHDLAIDKYHEALKADAKYVPAMIGLGRDAIQQHHLAEAEQQFRAALAVQPGSAESALGLAYVQMMRGGEELPKAERAVRSLIAERPSDPEAHYLLARICEQSGRTKDAAASFRKCAELLLEKGRSE